MDVQFSHSPARISTGIGFFHAECEEDGFRDCMLYWNRGGTFEVNNNKFSTFKEMETFVQDQMAMKHDPFKAAILRINKAIQTHVDKSAHTMDLRIAKFRGNLFTQVIDLKYGPNYRNNVLNSIIKELKTDKIVGL